MSEGRIGTDFEDEDAEPLTSEELDALAGGVMEMFYKHSEEIDE